MAYPRLLRALVGGAGLAACITVLAGQARAAQPLAQVAPTPPMMISRSIPRAPALFGTVALPVRMERYYDDWERARRDASALPAMRLLVAPARGLAPEQQIAFVQGAVHKRIHWISDATEWGYHDYWASAAETLSHGAGDMEDRAIVKMQALRTLGFPQRDLFMTIGKGPVSGQIVLLIVRLGGRYYTLDDLGGPPVLMERRPNFEPMLTLGYGESWIHGRRRVPGSGVAAVAASSIAKR